MARSYNLSKLILYTSSSSGLLDNASGIVVWGLDSRRWNFRLVLRCRRDGLSEDNWVFQGRREATFSSGRYRADCRRLRRFLCPQGTRVKFQTDLLPPLSPA